MPAAPRILERLPSLYRPEPGYDDDDLLLQLVQAVGGLLDQVSQDSAEVMQAHWLAYADSAIYSRWMGRSRELAGASPLRLGDSEIDTFPYLADLPRIGAIVDQYPWREPLRDREAVEAYRRRIRRIVQLHRDGLGTLAALRTMTLAALPQVDPDSAPGLRERPFTVEEFASVATRHKAIAQPGEPADLVGPLMRWQLDSMSLYPVSPIVIIQGVTPDPGRIDATSQPIIERFDPASGTGTGLHYQGDLAPDQALALVPGAASWLGTDNGVTLAGRTPAGLEPVDPTAPGPWATAPGTPGDSVVALVQTGDQMLWAAANNAGSGALWRHDGSAWSEVFSGMPELHCLLSLGGELLVGTAGGLTRIEIQPDGPLAADPPAGSLTNEAVHALVLDSVGTLWAATANGLATVEAGVLNYTALGSTEPTQTQLHAVLPSSGGVLYLGGELGLLRYRPADGVFHRLVGEGVDETIDDWIELDLNAALPDPADVRLPPVLSLARGPQMAIWIGTEAGIVRYRARESRRTYTTLVEAFPQLTATAVHAIANDVRGRLWLATGEGLFLHDDLDWLQAQGGALTRLPRPDPAADPVFWRYQRGAGHWQSLRPGDPRGFIDYPAAGDVPLGTAEPAVRAIAWTTTARAVLGSYDGSDFTPDGGASPAPLATRYKPAADRIVDGGIPALPALPTGVSHWRYLQREELAPPEPSARPAWTREGRLLPPPGVAAAPFEGRYLAEVDALGETVLAFPPAARVWFRWRPHQALGVTVRLARAAPDEQIDPLILDRVWNELQRVRPAGVAVHLAVDEETVRGQDNG